VLAFGALGLVLLVVVVLGGEIVRSAGDGSPAPIATGTATPPPVAVAPIAVTAATPTGSPPATPVADRPFVCLDPGHGGLDLGNVRLDGSAIVIQEKDLTLAHALALADRLDAAGIGVVLTRREDAEANPINRDVNGDGIVAAPDGAANSDELDDQQTRVFVCNEAGADLLVSIHYNGAENLDLEGYEVWFNQDRPFSDESERFATLIHNELGTRLPAAGLDASDRGIGFEDHAVTGPARPGELIPSEMPGVVVEGLFLSNDEDAAFVVTAAGQEALIGAYEAAIRRYFDRSPT